MPTIKVTFGLRLVKLRDKVNMETLYGSLAQLAE